MGTLERRHTSPGTRHRGYSLVELTLVLLLLGLFAATVIPGATDTDQPLAQAAAEEVAAALRFARDESLRTGTLHGVRVQPSPNELQVFRLDLSGPSPVEVRDVYHPVTRHLYSLPASEPPFAAGSKLAADFRYAAAGPLVAAVAFDARGEPVSPVDRKPLHQPGSVTVALRGAVRVVSLDTVTARTTVQ